MTSSTERKPFFIQYRGTIKIVLRYWDAYGGWSDLIRSPYLHASIALTLIFHDAWLNKPWHLSPIAILPNLLGFSLGGLAIWLAFGDDNFRQLLLEKENNDQHSSYVQSSASFVHFVIIQFLALIYAIGFQSLSYDVQKESPTEKTLTLLGLSSDFFYSLYNYTSFVGFLFFIYSLFSGVAATLHVFRMVTIFEKVANHPAYKIQKKQPKRKWVLYQGFHRIRSKKHKPKTSSKTTN